VAKYTLDIDVNYKSVEDLKGELQALEAEFSTLSIGSKGFTELGNKIKGIKSQLKDVELQFEGLDKEQRATALVDTFNGLTGAVGAVSSAFIAFGAESAAIEDAEKRSKGGVAAYVKGGSTDNEEQMKSVFSYRSFILDAAESQGRMTGVNAEIHQEGKREMISSNITPKGQVIPAFILAGEERALTTSTADTAKAGYLIQTEKLGGEYIDLLRNAVFDVFAGILAYGCIRD